MFKRFKTRISFKISRFEVMTEKINKKILIIKLSSLGDLFHTFPALSEAKEKNPDFEFDWLVDESFAEVPKINPAVSQVLTMPLRAWSKDKFNISKFLNLIKSIKKLRAQKYDLVIDAQGLIKSGLLTYLSRANLKKGLDKQSAREPWASFFYQESFYIEKNQHAIDRLKILFSKSLNQNLGVGANIVFAREYVAKTKNKTELKTILFLHGTTWKTKHWPDLYWIELGQKLTQAGFKILLPWGNQQEKSRAELFSKNFTAEILPKLSITELAELMREKISGIVALDSGLTHLAAALNIPTVSLYGPTDPVKTGPRGLNQVVLQADFPCAPCLSKTCKYQGVNPDPRIFPACFSQISPEKVSSALLKLIKLTFDQDFLAIKNNGQF